MERVNIINEIGRPIDVRIVRYFEDSGNAYFIYTLDEVDPDQYMRLYITKVMKEHGNFVGNTITDENEWNHVKGLIRQIAKESKNNMEISVDDLDDSDLESLNVNGRRPFKLMNTVVDGLALNRGVKKDIGEADEMFPVDFMESEPKIQKPQLSKNPRTEEIDYKSLAQHLQEELKAMEQELDAYKDKLNRIYSVLTEESR